MYTVVYKEKKQSCIKMMCALKYPIMHADFPNLWVCDSLGVCVPVCVLLVCMCVWQSQQFSDYYKPETSPAPGCLFRSLAQIFLMPSLRPQDTRGGRRGEERGKGQQGATRQGQNGSLNS